MTENPTPRAAAPALIVPCSGVNVRRVSDTHAELVLANPLVHASVIMAAEEVRTVADALHAAAGELTEAGSQLVTPAAPGKLVGPDGRQL